MFLWTGHFAQVEEPNNKRPVINVSKLTPLASDKFKAVNALDRELSDAVSFQYPKRNGWFLTCKNDTCFIEPKKRTISFERQSSFFPLINFWYEGYTVFESTVKAGWYIRRTRTNLKLEKYDGTEDFKKDASFKVNKPDNQREAINRPSTSNSCRTCCCSICDSQSDFCYSCQTQCLCKECETLAKMSTADRKDEDQCNKSE